MIGSYETGLKREGEERPEISTSKKGSERYTYNKTRSKRKGCPLGKRKECMYGGGAKIRKGETVAESCGRQQQESRGCVLLAELPHHLISNSHVGRFSQRTALNPKGITPRLRCSHLDRSR